MHDKIQAFIRQQEQRIPQLQLQLVQAEQNVKNITNELVAIRGAIFGAQSVQEMIDKDVKSEGA